jgi:hypothetical protein
MNKFHQQLVAVVWAMLAVGSSPALAVTTFLHHFDVANNGINTGAGPADYAVGNPAQLALPPEGPGGNIVPGGRFNNALDRTSGGRIRYATTGNYSPFKGTMEMWIKGPGVTDTTFQSLWGVDTSSGNTDIRFYIYNDQANDNLRSLGGYQLNAGAFWEIERPIPETMLDSTNWHHVVWQWDTTPGSEVTALWWDGVLLGNTPDDGYTVTPRTSFTNTRMNVGESQVGSAPWKGSMDELRISDHLVYDTNFNFTPPTAPFVPPVTGVFGDYNDNGTVDAADYTRYRDNLGANILLPNDSTPGSVTAADYTVWKTNFGLSGAGSAAASAAVPEPLGLVMLGTLAVLSTLRRQRTVSGET